VTGEHAGELKRTLDLVFTSSKMTLALRKGWGQAARLCLRRAVWIARNFQGKTLNHYLSKGPLLLNLLKWIAKPSLGARVPR
jgi:hypothetical protein